MLLEQATIRDVEEFVKRCDTAIIPTGATENHGAHLPLGTDFLIPRYLAEQVDTLTEALILPTLPFGISDAHDGFEGTLSVGFDAFRAVLDRLTDKLKRIGIRRIVFLNGHGGNSPALSQVCQELDREGVLTAVVNWWVVGGKLNPAWKGGHAGGQETAAILAIDPELVHQDRIEESRAVEVGEGLPHLDVATVLFRDVDIPIYRDMRRHFPAGWYGPDHPKNATAEWGREMLDAVAEFTAGFVEELKRATLPHR